MKKSLTVYYSGIEIASSLTEGCTYDATEEAYKDEVKEEFSEYGVTLEEQDVPRRSWESGNELSDEESFEIQRRLEAIAERGTFWK